jgi:hypothetical protein
MAHVYALVHGAWCKADPCPRFPQATKIIYVISWVHMDGVDTSSREAVRAVYDAGFKRLAHLCDLVSSERVPSLPAGKISMALTQRPASPGR